LRLGLLGIVVTTELSSRGLDAPYITHVIHFDSIPSNALQYVHRAGRCGRGVQVDDGEGARGQPQPLQQQPRPRFGMVLTLTCREQERNVPLRLITHELNTPLYTVEPRNGKLQCVE